MANQFETIEVTETRVIKRITLKGFIASIFNAFNVERGGIYTLKRLFSNPGSMTLHYLGKGRFQYTAPFRMLILSTALALLIINFMGFTADFMQGMEEGSEKLSSSQLDQIQAFISNYYNLILWLLIPIIAFFSWVFNINKHYNYAENLVLNTNIMIVSNFLMIFFFIDPYINNSELVILIYAIITAVYFFISYRTFFKKSIMRTLFDLIFIVLLSFIIYTILITLIIFSVLKFNI